nr:SIS domain-containing protein [uncultured Solibaculum sp.]
MKYIDQLMEERPELLPLQENLEKAVQAAIQCYEQGGTLFACGNGGSGADSEHIVGELLKGFLKKRPLSPDVAQRINGFAGKDIANRLQQGLGAVSLVSFSAAQTAIINDLGADLMYAQQLTGLCKKGDIVIGISTSGNADNVVNAFCVAKALGAVTIAMTGRSGGRLRDIADILLNVPADQTPRIQEYHLPVYHAFCADLEEHFFKE